MGMPGKASTEVGANRPARSLPLGLPRPRRKPVETTSNGVFDGRRRWAVADIGVLPFRIGIAVAMLWLCIFCALEIDAWPPHEDETLALFVGRHSLGHVLATVLGERVGAPLHFMLAWFVVHLGGGQIALRALSSACAILALPVVATLCARLAGRTVALAATAITAASWVLLFQAVFGRMYALFLLTSALSYLGLLQALARGGRHRWALWAVAILATIASHPYGLLVLASQGLFVLARRRQIREAVPAFAAVLVLGIPFWVADFVLSRRFDVGVGGGGAQLGAPGPVLHFLRYVAGDFTTADQFYLGAILAFALLGLIVLARLRPTAALLAGCTFLVPAVAMMATRLSYQAAPQSRHLIFALPLFALVVAAGLVELGGRRLRMRVAVAVVAVAALVTVELKWAYHKTPVLFTGEPAARVHAREQAAAWLASTARPDDVLFGYDPIFLLAWERNRGFGRTVIQRADPKLAVHALTHAGRLGRGLWVLDAGSNNNHWKRGTIAYALPEPASAFEARVFGPFLVVRTKEPTGTAATYLARAEAAMRLGISLYIDDDDLNLHTIELAQGRLTTQ
jgi:mannosyltransferase